MTLRHSIVSARVPGCPPWLFVLAFSVCLLMGAPSAPALECAVTGAAPQTAPDDTNDGSATACGDGAVAGGLGSVALGENSSSSGVSSTSLGRASKAIGDRSTALGTGSESGGNSSTAVGRFAKSPGLFGLALGYSTNASGLYSTTVGYSATASAESSAALGYSSVATANYSTAVGFRASAEKPYSVVLGAAAGVNGAAAYSDVGIGTTDPLAPLHVYRDDATQEFLLLESNEAATVQDRAMMYLVNNGGIRFEFENPVLNTAWRFQAATGNQDNFEIAKVGTGEIEFRVDADGNAYVAGLLFENSDRNTKTDIVPVDPEDVLEKVTQLPIAEWAYRESPGSRHIGPMAQDFHAAFRTGDSDRRLATMDVGGVAIASIQALAKRNETLESRNRELERRNADLAERVTRLESVGQENAELRERLSLVESMITQLLPQTAQN